MSLPQPARFAFCLLSALLLFVTGCAGPVKEETKPSPVPFARVYHCEDQVFSARFHDSQVRLDFGQRTLTLSQLPAASGARYGNKEMIFWSKGETALLEEADGQRRQCRASPAKDPWEEAALRGVRLRAVGQEPGWYLEILPHQWMRLVADYGETRIIAPAPAPRPAEGGRILYQAKTASATLAVEVNPRICTDTMSGEVSPLAVSVRINGRLLQGCGRWLERPR